MNAFTYIGIYMVGMFCLLVCIGVFLSMQDTPRRRKRERLEREAKEATTPTKHPWPDLRNVERSNYTFVINAGWPMPVQRSSKTRVTFEEIHCENN